MSELKITGATRIIGLIGNPVAQARSPILINQALHDRHLLGLSLFLPFSVSPAQLGSFVQGLRGLENFDGALVTMPFKQTILPLLDRISDAAQIVGAVNAIRRHADGTLEGDVLDGVGFVAGLNSAGYDLKDKTCLVYGSGGAASAIVCALAEQGVALIDIQNRTPQRAADLVTKVSAHWPFTQVRPEQSPTQAYDFVINATSLGMAEDDPLPIPVDVIERAQVVADIVVTREMTPLLIQAKDQGKAIHPGLPMLEGQLALFLDFVGITAE